MRVRVLAVMLPLGLGLSLPLGAQQTYSSNAPPPTVQLSIAERADIFMARRNYTAAVDLLSDAVRRHRADASIYNRLGIAYQQLANLGQAQKNFKKAIQMDRRTATYVNNLGTVYYMRRKYKDAAKEFTKAIQLDATHAPYFVNLGGAEFARKQFQPALAAYRQALRLDPDALFPTNGASPVVQDITGSDTPRFHYDLARLFCSMGMLDDAVHQFRQAYEQHYRNLKQSLTDPEFAPLRARPEYRALMGLPPAPTPAPTIPHA